MQLLDLSLLSFVQPSLEASEYHLVGSLGLAVGLGVLDRGEMLGRAKFGDELMEGVVSELGSVFDDYRLWDAKANEDISFVEVKDVLGSDFGQGFGFYLLGEVVDHYYQIFVLIVSDHEWAEEV